MLCGFHVRCFHGLQACQSMSICHIIFVYLQRATPKSFEQQMSNMQAKIQTKEDTITETIADIKSLKKEARATKDSKITK